MSEPADLGQDLHSHSVLTDGSASPEDMVDAAVAAGLHTYGLSDHVRRDSEWVDGYVARVRKIRRAGLMVRCGVEAKILDSTGRLDVPSRLPPLDYLLVADHQFPGADGPVSPREMAARLASEAMTGGDVVAELVEATARAVRRAPARPIIAHLFSLLPKVGLTEADVTDEQLHVLAGSCVAAGAAVEINEKWRCPSPSVVGVLRSAGVALVAGSDAHAPDAVGRWHYVHEVTTALTGVAAGSS